MECCSTAILILVGPRRPLLAKKWQQCPTILTVSNHFRQTLSLLQLVYCLLPHLSPLIYDFGPPCILGPWHLEWFSPLYGAPAWQVTRVTCLVVRSWDDNLSEGSWHLWHRERTMSASYQGVCRPLVERRRPCSALVWLEALGPAHTNTHCWYCVLMTWFTFIPLHVCFQIQFVPGSWSTLMLTHTWLMFTVGRVSLAGFLLLVILVITACWGAVAANPQGFVGAGLVPCRPIGLWGPLLELEDDLLRMKAISTVGSGLNGKRVFYEMHYALLQSNICFAIKLPKIATVCVATWIWCESGCSWPPRTSPRSETPCWLTPAGLRPAASRPATDVKPELTNIWLTATTTHIWTGPDWPQIYRTSHTKT